MPLAKGESETGQCGQSGERQGGGLGHSAGTQTGTCSTRDASAAPGLSVGTGTIPVGVTPAGQNDTVVASFHAPTFAGLRAFGIASGALSPANGESFRLLVVDTSVTPWAIATVHPQP